MANSFSKNRGLIFLIKGSYSNALKRCLGIDMTAISAFNEEAEFLLFNQYIPIRSTTTFDNDDAVLVDHLLFTLKRRKAPILDKDAFFRKLGFAFQQQWVQSVLGHSLLSRVSNYAIKTADGSLYQKTVFERLVEELSVAGLFLAYFKHCGLTAALTLNEQEDAVLAQGIARASISANLRQTISEYTFSVAVGSHDAFKKHVFNDVAN